MGLLDVLNTDQGRMGLGLLAAAGPRSDGAGFGQRLAEGMGSFDAYKANALKQKMLEAQMQEWQQKTAREKMLNDLALKKQAALPSLFTGGQQGLAPLVGDASIGILPSQGRASVSPTLDVQRALAAGYSPDEIAKLDSLRNVGMDEVARTVKGMQNGREVEQQFDKFGRPVGRGMEQYRAPIEVSTNAQKLLLDPYSRKPLSTFNMEQSPDSKASNALGWANNAATLRGQNMTDARARDLNDITRGEKKKVEDLTKGSQIASFDTMLGTLDRLGKHPGLSRSVGMIGAFPTMPGSESANFKAELDTFQSQAFIPMVSQLKGMGALSDAEGKKLTAAVGALNPAMGEKAFRESIDRITAEMEAARQRVSGQPTPRPAAQPAKAPMRGQVVQGYKFKGGDPSDQSNWEKQ